MTVLHSYIWENIVVFQADLEGFDTGRLRDSVSGGLFKFGQRTPTKYGDASTSHAARCLFGGPPLSEGSQRLLKSPRKPQRKVPKNPYKVRLDFNRLLFLLSVL